MKKNVISIKRVPGKGKPVITAKIEIQFDPLDPAAVKRFALMLKALIPLEERQQFVNDFNAAAAKAGFKARA